AADNLFISQPTLSYQIRLLEEEIGFALFERSGKGASLTPAGAQFVSFLTGMRKELKRAVEQGQNFSAKYTDSISVGLSVRQALFFLPEAMQVFEKTCPEVQITPKFRYEGSVEAFLKNETDVLFALKEQVRQIPGVLVHDLFVSRIYLIAGRTDPLAGKNLISEEDLYGRTVMVGGGSPEALRSVQHRLISSGKISYFNSADHDTTLTNVAAGKGVCLAPGFLNDHSGQFAWIPFDCSEHFDIVLCTHKNDSRQSLKLFLKTLKQLYDEAVAIPL
ncbi:MAG: LysR family transcriptional regulator, partial [Solobacterium sp.]|nr:LysR family transcriptional regulator [Solobacterium sp.]